MSYESKETSDNGEFDELDFAELFVQNEILKEGSEKHGTFQDMTLSLLTLDMKYGNL